MSEGAVQAGADGTQAGLAAPVESGAEGIEAVSPFAGASEEARGLAEVRGWKTVDDVVAGYVGLERLKGVPADKILRMPDEKTAPEEVAKFLRRLGRPDDPAGYALTAADPLNPTVIEDGPELRRILHDSALTQAQADRLMPQVNAYFEQALEARNVEAVAESEKEFAQLKTEWGATFDANVDLANQFMGNVAGFTAEEAARMQAALGTKRFFEQMAKIGRNFTEDGGSPRITPPDGAGRFDPTPVGARAKIKDLLRDPGFAARYREYDSPEFREIMRLQEIAASEGA